MHMHAHMYMPTHAQTHTDPGDSSLNPLLAGKFLFHLYYSLHFVVAVVYCFTGKPHIKELTVGAARSKKEADSITKSANYLGPSNSSMVKGCCWPRGSPLPSEEQSLHRVTTKETHPSQSRPHLSQAHTTDTRHTPGTCARGRF